MTVLADFLMLGHQQVGSFALSSDKTEMFSTAIGAFLDVICEVFNNKAIPMLIDMNGEHFDGITDYPTMEHGEVEDVDVKELAEFINSMVGAGIIVPDADLEDYVREIAKLPDKVERPQEKPDDSRTPQEEEDDEPDDEPTEEDVEAAKRRLGR